MGVVNLHSNSGNIETSRLGSGEGAFDFRSRERRRVAAPTQPGDAQPDFEYDADGFAVIPTVRFADASRKVRARAWLESLPPSSLLAVAIVVACALQLLVVGAVLLGVALT